MEKFGIFQWYAAIHPTLTEGLLRDAYGWKKKVPVSSSPAAARASIDVQPTRQLRFPFGTH
jgi:hypothetical protein